VSLDPLGRWIRRCPAHGDPLTGRRRSLLASALVLARSLAASLERLAEARNRKSRERLAPAPDFRIGPLVVKLRR
jgi:hypothetical protein